MGLSLHTGPLGDWVKVLCRHLSPLPALHWLSVLGFSRDEVLPTLVHWKQEMLRGGFWEPGWGFFPLQSACPLPGKSPTASYEVGMPSALVPPSCH